MIKLKKLILIESKYNDINQIQREIRKVLIKADIPIQKTAYSKTMIRGAPSKDTGVVFQFVVDGILGRFHNEFFDSSENPDIPKGFYDHWSKKSSLEYYRGVNIGFYTISRNLKQEKKMLKPIFNALKSAGFKPKMKNNYVYVSYDGLVDEMDRYKKMRN